jgi:hypothetical protein
MTHRVCTVVMLVIFNKQKIVTEFIVTFMIYLHTNFYNPSCHGQLIIAIKRNNKSRFCLIDILNSTK